MDGKSQTVFLPFVGGSAYQGQETMGREVDVMLKKRAQLSHRWGRAVAAAGQDFNAWLKENPTRPGVIAEKYL